MDDPLAVPAQQVLQGTYAEYRAAMAGWRSAAKAENVAVAEAAAERLLQARVLLFRALVDSGWTPPAPLAAQLERDAALLATPDDFEAVLGT
jgi:hypothetical protein